MKRQEQVRFTRWGRYIIRKREVHMQSANGRVTCRGACIHTGLLQSYTSLTPMGKFKQTTENRANTKSVMTLKTEN